ncbi:MAG: CoA transferase subunit A [Thermogemmatispora sp.]|jgi:glutaconate CoA-transferase subunit A|uniref:CoA transferase subunit A n=1 Tax=Thermogemmatispora aurantia TaxID=2045279 RepID=A0A5J4K8U4_9CHLR|nr:MULTISPECIES: CoA-transferase [Thermogemmatispora]MBE3566650.1 CoA transferase subunit A [Thermogemmatispora sp.]GER82566.1 CoA transferase subunit A [Thermogemmatispora aurantia]
MSKLLSMTEAIRRYVPDGAAVALGLALEPCIPFAAGHEIIRQGRRDLTLIGPISDILFDQLIGAGCVAKIQAAWVGNVSEGLGHCYRRATEQAQPRPIVTEDHSNFTIGLALRAASLGAPYIPTRSLLGSDLARKNSTFLQASSPFDGSPLLLVPALQPDVTILHVQRSDEDGNAHLWGSLGICQEAMLAARQVIIVAEEIVSREVITSDPNRVIGPSYKVCAVVHEPWGAHPSAVQGYYDRDHQFYHEYHTRTRTAEGFQQWLDEWVLGLKTRQEYMAKLAPARRGALSVKEHRYAAPVDYGY